MPSSSTVPEGPGSVSGAPDLPSDLREGYAEIGDVQLGVKAGEGPLVVLLHGFPEFWYGWRQQIQPLAAAGFRVVAPDLRGYNLSSKPDGVKAYDIGQLTADIRGLIHERGAESALLASHDWGGSGRLGHRDEPPRGRGPAGHPQRGPSAEAMAGTHTTRASSAGPGTSSSSTSPTCPRPSCTPTAGTSSGTSCMTPARPSRRRRSTATSRRGRSPARPPG